MFSKSLFYKAFELFGLPDSGYLIAQFRRQSDCLLGGGPSILLRYRRMKTLTIIAQM